MDRKDIEAVLYIDKKVSSDTLSVADRQSGNRVELNVRVPNQWEVGFSERSAVLELKIPLGSDIDIRSGNGSVLVKSVEGKLMVHTDNGNIEALGISGTLNIESGRGNLQVDGILAAVSLRTRTGNIAAQIAPRSKMNAAWVVRTGDGNVDLRLPEDFATNLDVDTADGNVRLDFHLTMLGGGRQSSIQREGDERQACHWQSADSLETLRLVPDGKTQAEPKKRVAKGPATYLSGSRHAR